MAVNIQDFAEEAAVGTFEFKAHVSVTAQRETNFPIRGITKGAKNVSSVMSYFF
jgi:hypothetical protein